MNFAVAGSTLKRHTTLGSVKRHRKSVYSKSSVLNAQGQVIFIFFVKLITSHYLKRYCLNSYKLLRVTCSQKCEIYIFLALYCSFFSLSNTTP